MKTNETWTGKKIDHRGELIPKPIDANMSFNDYCYYEDVDLQFAYSLAIDSREKYLNSLEEERNKDEKVINKIWELKNTIHDFYTLLRRHGFEKLVLPNFKLTFPEH